jgi:DNA-binding XRE family transcriptional regulator
MPYKFETEKLKIPKEHDRRRKLTVNDRLEIKRLYGKLSQRKLARLYGVSRRTITFIGCPEKNAQNLKKRAERGGSKIYYDNKKNNEYMKTHRAYKKELYDEHKLD